MFPAVLALADGLGKEVVVVEYDPVKTPITNLHMGNSDGLTAFNSLSNEELMYKIKHHGLIYIYSTTPFNSITMQ